MSLSTMSNTSRTSESFTLFRRRTPAGLSEFDQFSMLWPFAIYRNPARRRRRPGSLDPAPLGEDPSLTEQVYTDFATMRNTAIPIGIKEAQDKWHNAADSELCQSYSFL
ncbi:uncharacterized protein Dsimw501_GD28066, isoform A [Drosophila simulans]|nr:uncharacterized protein Dsimw501_GD28066, isoform A [Drosophila simulans]